MSDLVAFLAARLDEDEAVAKAALSEEWGDRSWAVTGCANRASGQDGENCLCIVYQGEYRPFDEPQRPPIQYVADAETPERAAHIALHDPARVLREVAAKRAILARYTHAARHDRPGKSEYGDGFSDGEVEAFRLTVGALAASYAGHPDYGPARATA